MFEGKKKWDYTMNGNEFEAAISIVEGRASCMFSKIYDLLESGGSDLSQDKDYLALKNLSDRIFEEKDKTLDYWMAEMDRLTDKLETKLEDKA
ncbi:hypothetical protein [uncultured Campylobacter sp.]|uniref:hypothetical protein n=1 Tax=uncultured Campylobacter sp. TaxID=218934 RepID=UPI00260BC4A4|nr:hypothetical protein [uncultured Campylobacter sp.]